MYFHLIKKVYCRLNQIFGSMCSTLRHESRLINFIYVHSGHPSINVPAQKESEVENFTLIKLTEPKILKELYVP